MGKFRFKSQLSCKPLLWEWFTCPALKVWNHFKTEQLNPIRNEWELAGQFLKTLQSGGDAFPSKPGLMLTFPPSFALSVLIAKPWGRGSSHPPFLRSLQSLWPRCVATIRTTLMGCEGPGRAGCAQPVGRSAGGSAHIACLHVPVCTAATAWNQTAQGFRRPAESASDPLLHSSWFYVTGTNHNILLFFFLMHDRSILKVHTAIW